MNNLIIFDLDGTLADTRVDLAYAVNLTRKHFGLSELPYETIITFVGNGAKKLIERSFSKEQDLPTEMILKVFLEYYSDNLIRETVLYPGVEETLKQLSDAGHLLAVLSNKPGTHCREMSTHFNLDKYFITVMGGGDATALKPDPAGITDIITKAESTGFNRNDSNIWMIGDHYTDLKSAENAGVGSIFCSYGFGHRQGLNSNHEITNFSELSRMFS